MNTTLTNLFLLSGIIGNALLLIAAIFFLIDKGKRFARNRRKRKIFRQEEEEEQYTPPPPPKRFVLLFAGGSAFITEQYEQLYKKWGVDYVDVDIFINPSANQGEQFVMIARIASNRIE